MELRFESHVFTKASLDLEIVLAQIDLSLSEATKYVEVNDQFLIGESFEIDNIYQRIKVTKLDSEFIEIDSILISSEKDIRLISIIPFEGGAMQLAGTYNCCNNIDEPAKAFLLINDDLMTLLKDESRIAKVDIYPNPAQNEVSFKFGESISNMGKGYILYQIVNEFNQPLLQGEITGEQISVDIENLTKGVYYVYFTNKTGQLLGVNKIVKL